MADLGTIVIKAKANSFRTNISNDDAYFSAPVLMTNQIKVKSENTLKTINTIALNLFTKIWCGHQKLSVDESVSKLSAISGVAKLHGIPTAGLLIKVFSRDSNVLIGATVSGVSGVFSLNIIGNGTSLCTVIAYDGSNIDNASIADLIIPIPV
jgi:hypothetical protein